MIRVIFLVVLLGVSIGSFAEQGSIRIASKNFSENYLLAEIMSQVLEIEGYVVERNFGFGGTLVCYEALANDEIDIYAEYTGTLEKVILKQNEQAPTVASLNSKLADSEMEILGSFGFNNTYAMAIKNELAIERNILTVSDLANEPDLKIAFSFEFLNREDGWPGLASTYGMSNQPIGIDHGLAYQAINDGKIDVTDAYSTDGDLQRYALTVLEDNRGYFPQYFAVPFVRKDLPGKVKAVLARLEGRIDDSRMRDLNAKVVVDGDSFAVVASEFLAEEGFGQSQLEDNVMLKNLARNTVVHLKLTLIALVLGIVFGLPLGVFVFRHKNVARVTLYVAGLLQTVPSIALLALMIPIFGIGEIPAIVALFLYSILPILRNTITALITIDPLLKRIAEAIGLTRIEQLRYVLIPLALPNILAGIKTAAIISIGTATLAAFIGAGGLGEPIVTGLALNDTNLILQGAIPAAGLAIIAELLFELLERVLVKEHMLRELPQ